MCGSVTAGTYGGRASIRENWGYPDRTYERDVVARHLGRENEDRGHRTISKTIERRRTHSIEERANQGKGRQTNQEQWNRGKAQTIYTREEYQQFRKLIPRYFWTGRPQPPETQNMSGEVVKNFITQIINHKREIGLRTHMLRTTSEHSLFSTRLMNISPNRV